MLNCKHNLRLKLENFKALLKLSFWENILLNNSFIYCWTISKKKTMFENDEQEQNHKIVNSKTSGSWVPILIIDFINLKMHFSF